MFAVVKSGGKQYKMSTGLVSEIEKIDGNVGDTVKFEDVVFVVDSDNKVLPEKKVTITAVIAKQFRAKKIRVFKKRQRTSGFKKSRGHRQYLTSVLVNDITVN